MKLDFDNDTLKVKLNPLEMLLCFQRSLSIPVDRMTEVSTEKPPSERGRTTNIPFSFRVTNDVAK